MTHETWVIQKGRLVDRFGERNFSKEFSLLVAIECRPIPDQDFVQMVNAMIGSRRPTDPPLIADFRQARLAWERRVFEREIGGALGAKDKIATDGLAKYLAKEFPGCKTLNEAIEVRSLQIRLAKADNPKYDPMCDSKWMGEYAWTPKDQL